MLRSDGTFLTGAKWDIKYTTSPQQEYKQSKLLSFQAKFNYVMQNYMSKVLIL